MIGKTNQLKLLYGKVKNNLTDPRLRNIRRHKTGKILLIVIRAFILTGLCFLIILPIFQKFMFAFRHPRDIANTQVVWIPENWSIENFRISYSYLEYNHSFWNTLILSVISSFLQIFATATIGYALAKLKFKGSTILFFLLILTLVVPNDSLAMARTLEFKNIPFFGIKLIGRTLAIYFMSGLGMGIRSAIFVYMFMQAFRGLPKELEESAEIDGAGVFQTFWRVMLPNVKSTIIVVGLFAFVWQWNDYYFASILEIQKALLTLKLSAGSNNLYATIWTSHYKIIIQLGEDIAQNARFYGLIVNTSALLSMLPLLIGYIFVQRKFVEGVERTGITGV